MNALFDLPAFAHDDLVNIVIDTPKGSRNKFKLDAVLGAIRLSRILPAGAVFPFDFGSIPGTLGDDGDALDVMVIMDAPSFPGCILEGRLIGVLTAEQGHGQGLQRNDRLLAVPVTPSNLDVYHHVDELPADLVHQITHFFQSYNLVQGRTFKPLAVEGPAQAGALVRAGQARYRKERT